jgi:hypothetical protein
VRRSVVEQQLALQWCLVFDLGIPALHEKTSASSILSRTFLNWPSHSAASIIYSD